MKIHQILPISGEHVFTDDQPWSHYEKHGDEWYVWMGESLEPVFANEELEEAYRLYKIKYACGGL